jgi:hypothetical protein
MLPPPETPPTRELQAAGAQFKVLAHVFPVLRQEIVRPVSNAGLALAMLRKAAPVNDSRREGLINELENMLTESAAELRRLDGWLEDSGETLPLADLLVFCRRLLFSHLLRTSRKIELPEDVPPLRVPQHGGRYVLLAWLLCLLDTLPDGATLQVESAQGEYLLAHPGERVDRERASGALPTIGYAEVLMLAERHGWQCQREESAWMLKPPTAIPLSGAD